MFDIKLPCRMTGSKSLVFTKRKTEKACTRERRNYPVFLPEKDNYWLLQIL